MSVQNPSATPTGPDNEPTLAAAQDKIANLEVALTTSRTIGIAIGIVVERRKISIDEAFTLLTELSKVQNRKVRDIASDIAFSGVIPD